MWTFNPPQKSRNTICEHNCANCFLCPFFFCTFAFWVFGVSGFLGSFCLRGMKKQKFKNDKQKNKKGSKTTRRKQENHLVLLQK